MELTAERLAAALDALGEIEPAFTAARARIGDPPPRIRARGYRTLLQAIVSQQVSVKAAAAILARVEDATGGCGDPANVARTSDGDLRAAGLSWGKISYVKSLAEEVLSGRLDFAHLPGEDEEAIAALTRVKGIGRWSAEVYLLFAEGRPDVWPAGDLAVRQEIGRILGLDDANPTEKHIRALAEAWRPHRGAAAIFAWHHRHIVPL
ncbi:DNA-3-methyladenine glycosylase 2 family protein [Sphingosinicella sp. LHD-64]|uniref:DNA-3-methyladenine glycosylase family protein n=1 Tax=Sphingosinicella sp. LHD-64 TaxID=3072139 RepID=UPI00280D9E8F|nr:DNA-3-methyladenine glycosylase 2 family protein [Sphingosinicella sp. LHD-64]MDQ8756278.1 DNA-3-methyladenine glycosylase 2 family protein [Sphingosinicella sp. LHD-64]